MRAENEAMYELHNELHRRYALLLGVKSPREMKGVNPAMAGRRVEIRLEGELGYAAPCPGCGKESTIADHARELTLRHLDIPQFETLVRAQGPRSQCLAAHDEPPPARP